MISELEKRVQRYWTQRSHDFGTVRRNELEDEMGRKWFQELEKHLPENGKLKVLDVGTGTGFFAVLLAQAGHRVEGVDLTPAMLEEARPWRPSGGWTSRSGRWTPRPWTMRTDASMPLSAGTSPGRCRTRSGPMASGSGC